MKEILSSLRIKNNYSQSAVASYLDVSRQMYIKYENDTAEPPLKIIRKLCELYKVSADVFVNNDKAASSKDVLYELNEDEYGKLSVASPAVSYGASVTEENGGLLSELMRMLPLLKLNEKLSLLSHLALNIEKQTMQPEPSVIKTKKIKKIPDAQYCSYIDSAENRKIREAGLAAVREILKNDEW